MAEDARRVPDGTTLRTDVCIVGAGPAGISLALALRNTGRSVVLLESGLAEPDAAIARLNEGRSTGHPMTWGGKQVGVDATRVRAFGGTSFHWGGWCRPLDPPVFERRDWVADSGWPFDADALAPHYAAAHAMIRLPDTSYGPEALMLHNPSARPVIDTDVMEPTLFQIRRTRFGPTYRDEVERSRSITTHLGATVVDVEVSGGGGKVDGVVVASLAGNRYRVEAPTVVLAVGGLETARLLLASDRVHSRGVGNRHDLVGRHFMEHPHVTAGRVALIDRPERPWMVLMNGPAADEDVVGAHNLAGGTMLRAPVRAARGLLDSIVVLGATPARAGVVADEDPARLAAAVLAEPAGTYRPATLEVRLEAEQEPDPASRVTLTNDRDALGLRRLSVDWRVSERAVADAVETAGIFGREIGRMGHGRYRAAEEPSVEIGNHHMGTARMHTDPRRGVVDADGMVHGVAGLYVCGSATFPTGGASNPTLTIVALALRLADHLARRVL